MKLMGTLFSRVINNYVDREPLRSILIPNLKLIQNCPISEAVDTMRGAEIIETSQVSRRAVS